MTNINQTIHSDILSRSLFYTINTQGDSDIGKGPNNKV